MSEHTPDELRNEMLNHRGPGPYHSQWMDWQDEAFLALDAHCREGRLPSEWTKARVEAQAKRIRELEATAERVYLRDQERIAALEAENREIFGLRQREKAHAEISEERLEMCGRLRERIAALEAEVTEYKTAYIALGVDNGRLSVQRDALVEAVIQVEAAGHNDNCLFCGFKDRVARAALAAAKEQP